MVLSDSRKFWLAAFIILLGCNSISETDQILREEIGDPFVQIVYIGPGGERLVKYANVMSNLYRSAGRTGMGCLMGSKNLKAVVVRGSKGVKVADPQALMEIIQWAYGILRQDKSAQVWTRLGTLAMHERDNLIGVSCGRNYQENVVDVSNYTAEVFEKYGSSPD